ncbi:class I adenylate-forming enzyme family protein [Paraliomyxa miuraensis]|uniref:class I adenylate-forming enzyme family protein n=1 Tax=Paraliomyxa miuraensis TaxID=376150 RepID=UPI002254FF23|nr:class I adenylate-forming enzyme family protein [Paraliomyxa miuraensis]MCX4240775.1 acyl--CoA ligase [Paraliomyxa miuraensis]
MFIFDLLRQSAEAHPDKPAGIFSLANASLPFGELWRRSNRVAAALHARGIGPGDRVAILSDNAPEAVVCFWGILEAGAQTVDMPTLAGRDVLQAILDEAAPRAIVIDPKQLAKHGGPSNPGHGGGLSLPELVITWGEGEATAAAQGRAVALLAAIEADESSPVPDPAVTADDVAMIVYTSGTTGRPNGVMLSHENFVSNLRASNELMKLTADHSILMVVPLYYIHGRMQQLMHAMTGGTVVFSAGFTFPAKVHRELCESGVRGFSGVPYHFSQLLDRSKLAQDPPKQLEYVLITGGALSPSGLERLRSALPGVGIHLAYGQTEAAPRITWIGPDELFVKRGSVGRALPNVTLEILGPNEEPVGPNVVGEVAAGGPNIMKGYVSGDERELGKIDDAGRLRTGDLGRIDEDGHLYLVGRSSEMIKSAGERIFPQEIEDVLHRFEGVQEVAVIGLPDETLGERVVAYIIPKDGVQLDRSALKQHCLAAMPFVRVPKEFVLVDELPQTASGKVSRSKLKAQLLEATRQQE